MTSSFRKLTDANDRHRGPSHGWSWGGREFRVERLLERIDTDLNALADVVPVVRRGELVERNLVRPSRVGQASLCGSEAIQIEKQAVERSLGFELLGQSRAVR